MSKFIDSVKIDLNATQLVGRASTSKGTSYLSLRDFYPNDI